MRHSSAAPASIFTAYRVRVPCVRLALSTQTHNAPRRSCFLVSVGHTRQPSMSIPSLTPNTLTNLHSIFVRGGFCDRTRPSPIAREHRASAPALLMPLVSSHTCPARSSHTHHHHASAQRLALTARGTAKSARERHPHRVSARARHGPARAVRRAGGRQDSARVRVFFGLTRTSVH